MFPDLDFILNSVIGLALVLAPIEIMVLYRLSGLWAWLSTVFSQFQDPETQKVLMRNVGQGVGAGLLERLGAAKGGAVRTGQAAIAEGISESVDLNAMGGLLEVIPRKYRKDLGMLIGGYQMLQQLKGGGLGNLLPGPQQQNGQQGRNGGIP